MMTQAMTGQEQKSGKRSKSEGMYFIYFIFNIDLVTYIYASRCCKRRRLLQQDHEPIVLGQLNPQRGSH